MKRERKNPGPAKAPKKAPPVAEPKAPEMEARSDARDEARERRLPGGTSEPKVAAKGLVVLGTERGCGKTVFMTGIAATLRENGVPTQAVKPIVMGPQRLYEAETNFICSIARTPLSSPPLVLERPVNLSSSLIGQMLTGKKSWNEFLLIETPGGCGTPLGRSPEGGFNWTDSTDLAREFKMPCVLVAKHEPDAIDKLIVNCSYLKKSGLDVLAMATVEVESVGGSAEAREMFLEDLSVSLLTRTGIPYLGCIPWSPSISVPRVNQGNLIKMTTGSIDLLILMKALNFFTS